MENTQIDTDYTFRPDKTANDILESLTRIEQTIGNLAYRINQIEKKLVTKVQLSQATAKGVPQEDMGTLTVPHPKPVHLRASVNMRSRGPVAANEDNRNPIFSVQASIPVNHTTGAAKLLLIAPISEMVKDIIGSKIFKNENYPMIQEEKRGLINLFGRGEGLDLAQCYDKDSLFNHGQNSTLSKGHLEVSCPAHDEWRQLDGLTPLDFENMTEMPRDGIRQSGMPPLDQETVLDLVNSYMENMNIMHPILIPRQVDALVKSFLKSTANCQSKHKNSFDSSPKDLDNLRQKQMQSPEFGGQIEPKSKVSDYRPCYPFRSIRTALVLLILALGKICQHNTKIPDVASTSEDDIYNAPDNGPILSSSSQQSPVLSTMSPDMSFLQEAEEIFSRNQPNFIKPFGHVPLDRLSGYPHRSSLKPRNLDVIPGLAYFALATDIIGNQIGGHTLQHVHVNILAGLYHGQLARVLESHAYIYQACCSLQILLQPELERFRQLKQDMHAVPVKDNPLVFAFWTCLQLER